MNWNILIFLTFIACTIVVAGYFPIVTAATYVVVVILLLSHNNYSEHDDGDGSKFRYHK